MAEVIEVVYEDGVFKPVKKSGFARKNEAEN
jgi:predicted DNA-binding antitoxin AbrB/MazE fold protein